MNTIIESVDNREKSLQIMIMGEKNTYNKMIYRRFLELPSIYHVSKPDSTTEKVIESEKTVITCFIRS